MNNIVAIATSSCAPNRLEALYIIKLGDSISINKDDRYELHWENLQLIADITAQRK
ncbi:hypothetical protein L7G72_12260 [Xenorhabdus bovienii]|uniref:Uncharacterized protein n=1 Tax=Xenorhabdus bovienii TaxID=40576 RepID=A0A0B6X682_XENBV|nr:hypothetical protein [Xenorhabdus bovienii]MCG3462614.1 hypothetical protein [Xenorhabdus bovienii]CDM89402.1 protein of unknown function [Xenorhabdus bovienii]